MNLKTTISIGSSCLMTISDVTGFYDVSTNPTGFLSTGASLDPNRYKLTDGYFLNVILYNKYGVPPVMINTTEVWAKANTPIDLVYTNNLTPETYQMLQDGSYTLTRYFLISDVYYNANKTGSLFTGKTVYYTNGTNIYKVVNNVPTAVLLADFIVSNLTAITGAVTTTHFVSTCYINRCYYQVSMKLLPHSLACDNLSDAVVKQLKQGRDYLFMVLEVIKYLTQQNNTTQIQKLLETANSCGGICQQHFQVTSSNCGCNG